jgi:hypothetical protein
MNARTAARFTEEPDFDLTQMHLILRAVLSQTTCGPEMPDGLTLQPGNPRCGWVFRRKSFASSGGSPSSKISKELICIVYDFHPNPHWPLGTFPPTRMHLRTRGPVTCHSYFGAGSDRSIGVRPGAVRRSPPASFRDSPDERSSCETTRSSPRAA